MSIFTKTKSWIANHKFWSVVILAALVFFGHWAYGKFTSTAADTRYVTAQVATGTVISTVSGTGQVSASNQLNVTPQASGNITSINVTNGQQVSAGTLIAQIDDTDAEKTVRDDELDLESSQLSLQKLQIQDSSTNVNTDLSTAYQSGFSAVSNTFLDLPATMTGLQTMLDSKELSSFAAEQAGNTAADYQDTAEKSFYVADTAYETNKTDFQALTPNSSPTDISNIITETYDTEKLVAQAVGDMKNLADYLSENAKNASEYTSDESNLSSYVTSTNNHISDLSSAQTDIQTNQQNVPSTNIDLQSAELDVQQKENALEDAKEALADYSVVAPFSGTIAVVNSKVGDAVTSSTDIATLITSSQIGEMSLNEVDVAKVQLGQKVTLTFDAIPGLTVAGTVAEINPIGTVSSGVVSYDVQINFDTQDSRIKSGMSFSANVVTNIAQDVPVVPNSAIKTINGASYVQMFSTPLPAPTDGLTGSISATPPNNVPVQVGIADDTNTQIISGLNVGDQIVVRTVTPSTTATAKTTAPSLIGGGAARGGAAAGGAAFRGGGG